MDAGADDPLIKGLAGQEKIGDGQNDSIFIVLGLSEERRQLKGLLGALGVRLARTLKMRMVVRGVGTVGVLTLGACVICFMVAIPNGAAIVVVA